MRLIFFSTRGLKQKSQQYSWHPFSNTFEHLSSCEAMTNSNDTPGSIRGGNLTWSDVDSHFAGSLSQLLWTRGHELKCGQTLDQSFPSLPQIPNGS